MSLQNFNAVLSASTPLDRTSSFGSESRWFQWTESTTPGTMRPVSPMHRLASSTVTPLGLSSSTPSNPNSLSSVNFSKSVLPSLTIPIFTAFLNFLSVGFSSAANHRAACAEPTATAELITNSRRPNRIGAHLLKAKGTPDHRLTISHHFSQRKDFFFFNERRKGAQIRNEGDKLFASLRLCVLCAFALNKRRVHYDSASLHWMSP